MIIKEKTIMRGGGFSQDVEMTFKFRTPDLHGVSV